MLRSTHAQYLSVGRIIAAWSPSDSSRTRSQRAHANLRPGLAGEDFGRRAEIYNVATGRPRGMVLLGGFGLILRNSANILDVGILMTALVNRQIALTFQDRSHGGGT